MSNKKDEFKILGQNIKRLREEKKIPVSDFSKKLHISEKSLRLLESGIPTKTLGVSSIFLAAKYLEVSLAELFKMNLK